MTGPTILLALLPAVALAIPQEDAAKAECEALRNEYWQGLATKDREPTTEADRAKYEVAYLERRAQYARRFLDLARKHARLATAVDELMWILETFGSTKAAEQAADALIEEQLANDELPGAIRNMATQPFPAAKGLLRRCLEKSTDKTLRGNAWYSLARLTKDESDLVRHLQTTTDQKQLWQLTLVFGSDRLEELKTGDADQLRKQCEAMFERVVTEFADIKTLRSTLGNLASAELFELRSLGVGQAAPEIEGEDIDGRPMKLSDYRGKIVLLDFWGHW